MALKPGDRLGSFEILSLLGSGGMGEVYKARDTKLGRTVAIKRLKKEFASDAERLKRFEQEAKAASALDHPNIITIHDIAEAEGQHFIVMQYVEGKTLRELIGAREVNLGKSLHYAIQMADGLARAHSQGIVHRDLKPDNVMVTEDGLVKILDFGLAKLAEPSEWTEAPTQDLEQPLTKEGHIIGTAPYMSPEQAQGKKLDGRSDIFSFGSVLYEMVTGRRVFQEESVPGLLVAIIKEEPKKLSETVPSVPLDLEKLVARTMRKEPQRRFHSMDDVRVELQDIKKEWESGSFVSASQITGARGRAARRHVLWVAAAVFAIGLGLFVWLYILPSESTHPPPRTIPLTAYPGVEAYPAISPDGNQVVFTWAGGSEGPSNLYVKMIDGGEPLLVSRGSRDCFTPTWSPDGRQIAFIRHIEEDGEVVNGIFVVSALGGAERRLVTSRAESDGLSWSPDGNLLAIVDKESAQDPDSIFLLLLGTGERQRLTTPPPGHAGDQQPCFSPDGLAVAFIRQRSTVQSDIYLVPVDGGEPQRLTFGNQVTSGLDWTPDGRSIVFSSTRSGRAGYHSLWRVGSSGGEPEPLEVGEEGLGPTISRRGGRLAYVKGSQRADIWRQGGPAAGEEEKTASRFISSTRFNNFPQYSPDGQKILFGSFRSGFLETWICDSDGTNPRQLTYLEDPSTFPGCWSPDGRQIALYSHIEGSEDIYVINVTGGFPRRLTSDTWDEGYPGWSRDGGWIYFSSNRTGSNEVYRMPAEGGEATQLTTNGGTKAIESLDRRFIYFTKSSHRGGPHGIWRIPIDGGEEIQVHDRGQSVLWDVLEQSICYMNHDANPVTIELFDTVTSEVRVVAVPETPPSIWGFAVSPDGRWILYQGAADAEYDIMLVENFR